MSVDRPPFQPQVREESLGRTPPRGAKAMLDRPLRPRRNEPVVLPLVAHGVMGRSRDQVTAEEVRTRSSLRVIRRSRRVWVGDPTLRDPRRKPPGHGNTQASPHRRPGLISRVHDVGRAFGKWTTRPQRSHFNSTPGTVARPQKRQNADGGGARSGFDRARSRPTTTGFASTRPEIQGHMTWSRAALARFSSRVASTGESAESHGSASDDASRQIARAIFRTDRSARG